MIVIVNVAILGLVVGTPVYNVSAMAKKKHTSALELGQQGGRDSCTHPDDAIGIY